ncbi:MAG: AIR synthase family protein [Clostridiales bacterium]|nr:AIR synthase family protein [Clostridiales bacterium]
METGKLPSEMLEKYIFKKAKSNKAKRNEVIVRPSLGEDCAVLDMGNEFLILSTDPITGACENLGRLLVNINSNDIYSNGCEPIGLLITLLLPPDFKEEALSTLSDELFSETEKAGLEILGGHTEITDAVNRPVVSATVVGKSVNRNFIKTGGAEIGQDVIMTKYAALEGTSILAADNETALSEFLPKKTIEKAKSLSSLLSVRKEGLIAPKYGATSMHDVTEGGILGACYEIAEGSVVGITVYADNIPVLEETKEICRLFGINPLRLISSGSMLITAHNGERLVDALEKEGVRAEIIGKITEKNKYIIYNNKKEVLGVPEPDQIYSARLK